MPVLTPSLLVRRTAERVAIFHERRRAASDVTRYMASNFMTCKTSMKKITLILFISLPAVSCWAQELRQPTNTELRVAYCFKVKSLGAEMLRQNLPDKSQVSQDTWMRLQQSKIERDGIIERLGQFMRPRLLQVDSEQIVLAMISAKRDFEQSMVEAQKCLDTCLVEKCLHTCSAEGSNASPAMKQIGICNDLSWMPY